MAPLQKKISDYSDWQNPEDYCFLVYQMGKVGSSTINYSLINANHISHHTHIHDEAAALIRNANCNLVVVSGFREPLSRCISEFFQNIDNRSRPTWYLGSREEILKISTKELIDFFDQRVILHIEKSLAPWFDGFVKSTGISAAHLTALKDSHYCKIGKMDIIIYKLEEFDDFRKMFFEKYSPQLNFSDFEDTNLGESKWYRSIYKKFLSEFQISQARYNELFANVPYVTWLYTDEELKRYSRRFVV